MQYSTALKDYEKKEVKTGIVPKLTKYIKFVPTEKQQVFLLLDKYRDVFFGGAAGGAKGQPLDELVCTPFGFRKMGDLKVGSILNNPDGTIQKIISIHPQGKKDIYEVEFIDGAKTRVTDDHIWKYSISKKGKWRKSGLRWKLGTTLQLIELRKNYNILVPLTKPIKFTKSYKVNMRTIHPYVLGVLLGDGSIIRNVSFTNIDEFLINKFFELLGRCEYRKSKITYFIKGEKGKELKRELKRFGLYGKKSKDKFIPESYKLGTIDERIEMIQGLMDTDGTVTKDFYSSYTTVSKQLAEDVQFILRSLGCKATITTKIGAYRKKDGSRKICQTVYTIYIASSNNSFLFSLPRKKQLASQYGMFNEVKRRIVNIKKVGREKAQCIKVDNPNGLYITRDFIVTHNTIALLMAALQYVDVPGYNALLIRDKFTNLVKPGGLYPVSHEWLSNTDAHWSGQKNSWIFPNKATLSFGHLDRPMDHFNYQGPEYQFIGIDEMVGVREYQAVYLFSRLRKIKGKNCPIRFRGASNPPTREQLARGAWVKRRYVDPKTRKPGVVFLPAWMTDNPHLDIDEYKKSLANLDPITRAQLEKGDWNVRVKGKMFERGWFTMIDTLPVDVYQKLRYWDYAATEKNERERKGKDPAFTTGVRMSKTKGGIYIVENVKRIRAKPKGVDDFILNTAHIDGKKTHIWGEQEPGSSGIMVIAYYTRLLAGYRFKGDRVTGSKIERAGPFSSQAEAGNVWILKAPWNEEYLEELELFPDGEFKDQVDASSGAFDKLSFGTGRIRSSVVGGEEEQSIIDKILEEEKKR